MKEESDRDCPPAAARWPTGKPCGGIATFAVSDAGGWLSRDIGRADWTAITALAASATALAALVAAIMIFSHVRRDAHSVRFNAKLESLWRLVDQWNSPDMIAVRSAAASALLADQANREVDDILDFLDEVAFLLSRDALDEEMVWYELYRPLVHYWFASQSHVRQAQRRDPAAWQHLGRAVTRLTAIEARRKHRPADELVPSQADIHEFLASEISASEGGEEALEARRFPM